MATERKQATLLPDEYNPRGYFKSFYKVPKEILAVPDQLLSDGAKLLFSVIAGMAFASGTAYPKIETLCAIMGGKDRRTIERFMRELKVIGLVRSKFKGKRLPNNYYLMRSGIVGNGTPEQNAEWEELKAKLTFLHEEQEWNRKQKRSTYERERKAKKTQEAIELAVAIARWEDKKQFQDEQMRLAEEGWVKEASGSAPITQAP